MKMSQLELNEIINLHRKWLRGELGGARANLYGADLSRADLSGADLSRADLSGANLYGADLSRADLPRADLSGANLFGANLFMANLYRANLYGADLSGADLSGAKKLFVPMTCPDTGAFIGWKKAILLEDGEKTGSVIVKLRICDEAKRSSSAGRKCRCDRAEVLEIQNMDGSKVEHGIAISDHDHDFQYITGTIVSVADFDVNRWQECAAGIHFFVNRQEAVNYPL